MQYFIQHVSIRPIMVMKSEIIFDYVYHDVRIVNIME